MSTSRTPPSTRRPIGAFLAAFALVALLIAGGVSYLASGNPDGLDAATLEGCTENADGSLTGSCIAQNAEDHSLSGGFLADYTIGGNEGLTGVAGILGVVATFAVAGGLFYLIARSRKKS